jgi:hypothetical protein
MKKDTREHRAVEEPVGIVIAGGIRAEVTPRFAAFMWAPAPDEVAAASTVDATAA